MQDLISIARGFNLMGNPQNHREPAWNVSSPVWQRVGMTGKACWNESHLVFEKDNFTTAESPEIFRKPIPTKPASFTTERDYDIPG